jgi:hypothetical protein
VEILSYISDLLDEHEYVVIPGLGALISSYRPAKFSEDNSTLLPPSRTVSFNPELKINDGLLARYIAQQKKITLTNAAAELERYTGDVLYRLEAGEEVLWDNIGSLILRQGQFTFNPAGSSQENSASYGLQPVVFSDFKTISEKKDEDPVQGKRKKRFSRWIWTGSILLFFLIALTFYFAFFTNHKTIEQSEPTIHKDTTENKKPEPQVSPDSTVFEQNEIKPASIDSLFLHPRAELYYTIAGSFRAQQNALEYYEKMRLKGFHPIQLGLIGNFYLVALDTFFTAKDAFDAADKYPTVNRKTEIWVFHPK